MNDVEEKPVRVWVRRDAVERAKAALIECAQDLEVELRARYPQASAEAYPSVRRRFERDMAPVRAALAAAGELDWHPDKATNEGADE